MPSIAKLSVTFGLVCVPVRLHAVTEEHGVLLHQVHAGGCGGRIRLRRVCEKCGREVPYADVARGYEDKASGRTAVLTEADMEALPLPSIRAIDVLAFVDTKDIDPVLLSKAYYLEPDLEHGLVQTAQLDRGCPAGVAARELLAVRLGVDGGSVPLGAMVGEKPDIDHFLTGLEAVARSPLGSYEGRVLHFEGNPERGVRGDGQDVGTPPALGCGNRGVVDVEGPVTQ